MPLTVNIVSGSALTVNMGFAQIGGAKIKTMKNQRMYPNTTWHKSVANNCTKGSISQRSASSLVMTVKTIVEIRG